MPLETSPTSAIKDEVQNFKRQRILDAASDLFFESGYKGTSIDAIAERIQVTKPFIYYHFNTKADILAAVCGRTTAFVAELAEQQAAKAGPVQERLKELVRELSRRVIEGRVYLAVYFREEKHLPEAAFRKLADDRRRFDQALSNLLEEGVRSGAFDISKIHVATEAITGMTTWLFNWYRPKGPLTPEQVAEEMAELALRMVETRMPRA
jgi:AcrR family transcriptional regulator